MRKISLEKLRVGMIVGCSNPNSLCWENKLQKITKIQRSGMVTVNAKPVNGTVGRIEKGFGACSCPNLHNLYQVEEYEPMVYANWPNDEHGRPQPGSPNYLTMMSTYTNISPNAGTLSMKTLNEAYKSMADDLGKQFYNDYTPGRIYPMYFTQPKPTLMTQLTNAIKKFVDADVQTLIKAGYVNGDLQLTQYGRDKMTELLYIERKTDLAKMAQEELDEAKK